MFAIVYSFGYFVLIAAIYSGLGYFSFTAARLASTADLSSVS
jgi:hypothetical protein